MVAGRRILLINGSPRKKGTSFSFARTLAALAGQVGSSASIEHMIDYYDGRKSLEHLREQVVQSDIIGLSSPLYYDSLPGPTVWLFEQLQREMPEVLQGKTFFAVSQCAYPFATLCEPLLASCHCFAEATGMRWLGGLGYGFGVLIDGADLDRLGRKGRKITKALRLALEAVLQGQPVPAEAQELLMIRIPRILYRPLAVAMNGLIWLKARRLGVKDLDRKVYLT